MVRRTAVMFGIFIVLATVCAHATDYFISPTGRDANSGFAATAPWKTFAYAVPKLIAGDTLYVMDGTFDGSNGTDWPSISSAAGAKSGSSGNYIKIKALNERRVTIKSDGYHSAIELRNGSYWGIEGLYARSQDINSGLSIPSYPFWAYHCDHLTVRRCVFAYTNRYHNESCITFEGTNNSLIEECEGYFYHRNGCTFGIGSSNNTARRCYMNSRAYSDIAGGRASDPTDKGDSGFTVYPGANNTFENCVSEGNAANDIEAAANYSTPATVSSGNRYFGCVSLNDDYGFVPVIRDPGDSSIYQPQDTVYEHCIVINPAYVGFYLRGTLRTTIKNCTVMNSRSNTGFIVDVPSAYSLKSDAVAFINDLALSNVGGGFYIDTAKTNTWSIKYSNSYGNSGWGNYTPRTPSTYISNSLSSNALLGDSKVVIPPSTPMKGAGQNSEDIGANIVYRYQGGVLTSQKLWDATTGEFPHGAFIAGLNDVAGSSLFDVNKRLNVKVTGSAIAAPRNLSFHGGTTAASTIQR
jgi:hypothetical protein